MRASIGSSCTEQPFLSLSYRNACLSSSITTTRSRHTCNAQRVVNGMDIWYTGMHWICHNIALADIYLADSRTSAHLQKKNYREINFHLAKQPQEPQRVVRYDNQRIGANLRSHSHQRLTNSHPIPLITVGCSLRVTSPVAWFSQNKWNYRDIV